MKGAFYACASVSACVSACVSASASGCVCETTSMSP